MNQQRSILNELEENLNEKKRKFKYEIMLSDELNNLKKIEQNVDNPAKINQEAMKKAGIEVPSAAVAKPQKEQAKQEEVKQQDKWRPMVIDLEMQVIDSVPRRLWAHMKYFTSHIFLDKCSIILILLAAGLITFTLICFSLPFKAGHPAAPYK